MQYLMKTLITVKHDVLANAKNKHKIRLLEQ